MVLSLRPRWQVLLLVAWFTTVAALSGDADVVIGVVLALLAGVLAARVILVRGAVRALVQQAWTPREPEETRSAVGWFAAGALVVATGLWLVERRDAPFFLQDDNFDQFLPVIGWGARSLAAGVFPAWNPYQFLGAPTAEVGTYALTYPITYLAYAIANALGHFEWTIEVFAITHLALGYAATFWAGRKLGIAPALASCAALSFTLSGYHLIAGRCWYYMLPVAVWAPLLVGLVARLEAHPVGWSWAAATGLVLGVFFHAGNAQMWSYALLFFGVALSTLVLTRAITPTRGAWGIVAISMGVGIAAPLLVPQFLFARNLQRVMFEGGDIRHGLLAILTPFGLAPGAHPMVGVWPQSSVREPHAQLYSAGAILPAIALCGCFVLVAMRPLRPARGPLVWLLGCTLLAFLGALGDVGGVWPVLARLPVFKAFQLPYKLLGFFNLYACLVGALLLQRCMAGRRIVASVWLLTAAASLHATFVPLPSNFSWARRSYVAAHEGLREHLNASSRVMPLGPNRTNENDYPLSLQNNMASVYGWPAFHGYDPFVAATEETRRTGRLLHEQPAGALEAWGFRHVLLRVDKPAAGVDAFGEWLDPSRLPGDLRPVVRVGPSILLARDAAPLAFLQDAPRQEVPFTVSGRGISVVLPPSQSARDLTVNYVHRPSFSAVDEHSQTLLLGADEWGRMRVTVPPGTSKILVRYEPPFKLGVTLGFLLLACAAALAAALQRRSL